jgi:hypothetical protein
VILLRLSTVSISGWTSTVWWRNWRWPASTLNFGSTRQTVSSPLSLGILFYLYPTQLNPSELDAMINDQTLVTELFNTYYSSLVPVRYLR